MPLQTIPSSQEHGREYEGRDTKEELLNSDKSHDYQVFAHINFNIPKLHASI